MRSQGGERGRRPIGGTSSGARSVGGHYGPPATSVRQRRPQGHGFQNAAVVAGGVLVLAVGLLSTGVLAEYALAFAGAGFMCGVGAGCALVEGTR